MLPIKIRLRDIYPAFVVVLGKEKCQWHLGAENGVAAASQDERKAGGERFGA